MLIMLQGFKNLFKKKKTQGYQNEIENTKMMSQQLKILSTHDNRETRLLATDNEELNSFGSELYQYPTPTEMAITGDIAVVHDIQFIKNRRQIKLLIGINDDHMHMFNATLHDHEDKDVKCQEFLYQLKRLIFSVFNVWNPEEKKRMTWDICSMVFIFVQMLSIPLILAFGIDPDEGFTLFDQIMNYFFMIDILISFQTGFYDRGNLILERSKIALKYMEFWFWIDVVSSFPYDQVIQATSSDSKKNTVLLRFVRFFKFIKVVRLLRALKLKRLFAKLEETLSFAQTINILLSFLKHCFMILCIAHWCACLFFLIQSWEDGQKTWVDVYGIQNQDWKIKYISSLYYSITTMITVGYGDILPSTDSERLFSVFFMILASGVFGYSMNSIMVLFSDKDDSVQDLKEKNSIMIKYMKQKDIPNILQSRVKNYLEWLTDQQQIARNFEQQLIENLSANLKTEIVSLINGRIIMDISFIADRFSRQFLNKLVFQLQEKIHGPEEFIFMDYDRPSQFDQRCIYYLVNGTCAVFARRASSKSNLIAVLKKGTYFGEIGFFANVQRTAAVQSEDFVNLFYISREEFLSLAGSDSKDLQTFHQLKYHIEVEEDLNDLTIECFSCKCMGHVAKYCPKTHYVITRQQRGTLIRSTKEKLNNKIKKIRNQRRKTNTLILSTLHSIKAAIFKLESVCLTPKVARDISDDISDSDDEDDYTESKKSEPSPCHFFHGKHHIRESFQLDHYKNYEAFLPISNCQRILESLNYQADEIIEKLKSEKDFKIAKMMEQVQNRQKDKRVGFSVQVEQEVKLPTKDREKIMRRKTFFDKKRLVEVKDKRQIEEKKRNNIFSRISRQNYFENQINQLMSATSRRSESSTLVRFTEDLNQFNFLEGQVQPLPLPAVKNKQLKNKRNLMLVRIQKKKVSLSSNIYDRQDLLKKAQKVHRRHVLENMMYLAFNRTLRKHHE